MTQTIKLKQYKKSGDLTYSYNPLHNLYESESNKILKDFSTKNLSYDSDRPVTIECQQSYDGSVNLLLIDDNDSPRIINTAFTVQEHDKYERVLRNQSVATNYYSDETVDSTTRLQRTISADHGFLVMNLESIDDDGLLKGGNYVFMIRYCDEDYNETSIISESGIISVFKGTQNNNAVGTLQNELANKTIVLKLSNFDPAYNHFKVIYKRSFCDLTGALEWEYKEIVKPYKININNDGEYILRIDGYEQTVDITYDDIIATNNVYNTARTEAQVQNTLFFGNVSEAVEKQKELQQLSYYIKVTAKTQDIFQKGVFEHNSIDCSDYVDPINTYNYLGYMPNELYRIGVVYIYNNDTISSVYNLRGNKLELDSYNYSGDIDPYLEVDFDITSTFISDYENTKGVFIMPNVAVNQNNICPISLQFEVDSIIANKLHTLGIKGYYFVRQKRIPNFLAQGFSIGVSDNAYIPMLPKSSDKENDANKYFTQSVISNVDADKNEGTLGKIEVISTNAKNRGLICADAFLNRGLQSLLDGSKFKLVKVGTYSISNSFNTYIKATVESCDPVCVEAQLIYVPEDTSTRIYNSLVFSTKSGSSEELHSIRNLEWGPTTKDKPVDSNTVRGNYTPFIGVVYPKTEDSVESDVTKLELDYSSVYNIYLNYCESINDWQNAITVRANDKSEFTSISDKFSINTKDTCTHKVYRGDCFTGEVSTKFQWNFLDYNTPLNNTIVKTTFKWSEKEIDSKKENYNDYSNVSWENLNISDWNAVPIGYTFAYRYMSNYNISIRSIDRLRTDEMALFGSYRSFYPHATYTDSVAWKLPDSNLLNVGLSTTQTCLPHFEVELVPYIKHTFDNRIAFSEIQQQGGFQNGYRVFKGLSYQDIDSSYGSIVKLLPFGANLFCVFEHGCGIIPVNEKALITTTTGQSVHMKGTDVIQSQITVVSQDYGSIHEDSVIITPNGIYGVDVFAKKIWRFANNQFTIISDQYVQRFLNENISNDNRDTWVGFKNVKTHYNNYKGDIMFTFYNEDKCWNLCYNERIGKFTTKYSWTPLLSDNIQNSFISFNKEPAEIYGCIAYNDKNQKGLNLPSNFAFYNANITHSAVVNLIGYNIDNIKDFIINKVSYPTLIDDSVIIKEIPITNVVKDYDIETTALETITISDDSISAVINVDNSWSIQLTRLSSNFFTPWIKIDITVNFNSDQINQTICFALNPSIAKELAGNNRKLYEKTLVSKLYTHGFAGNHKELNYLDSNPDNQLKPTYWYDKQEPFEFEFVINTPTGIQKIFNNLSIISNNAEPQSLEISLIGDSYDFNKANIYKSEHFVEPKFKDGVFNENQYNIDKQDLEFNNTEYSQDFINMNGIQYETSIDFDPILNQYYLKVKDDCRNIKDSRYGRRLGNIEYKEDKWNLTLTPIYYKQKELKNGEIAESKINSTRIRDKWIKVRIKYTGEKLVVISAIQTLMTLSFA